jgi:hypothetical protein
MGHIGRPVAFAAWITPGWTTYLGPLGPSGVNAMLKPSRASFINSFNAEMPPRVVEPREEAMPKYFTSLAISSPSLCLLTITETGLESFIKGIRSILPCQKENITCVSFGGRFIALRRSVSLKTFSRKAPKGGTKNISNLSERFDMLSRKLPELHIIQPLIDAAC